MNKEQVEQMVFAYRHDMMTRGIKVGKISRVLVSDKSFGKFGSCRRLINGYFVIEITDLGLHGDVKTTIVHELIHTVEGCFNHGPKFQEIARLLSSAYNIELGTKASKNEMELSKEYRIAKAKYVIRCKKCGQIITRQRATRLVKLPMTYRCGCGGDLERIK